MVEEVVTIDPTDRRSLYLRQPIAASGRVRIMVNDDAGMFIPPGGLLSAAILSSSVSGPYDILVNEDTLTVTASSGTATIVLGASTVTIRMTPDAVIKKIRQAGWEHVDVSNDNGYLVFTDSQAVGPSAYVKVTGTAAGVLGFGQSGYSGAQWAAYGREIYPGWDLYLREDTITNRFPRFRKALRKNPMLKVSYVVPVQRCLRCRASFVENDFRYNAAGDMILIRNEDLLYQAAL